MKSEYLGTEVSYKNGYEAGVADTEKRYSLPLKALDKACQLLKKYGPADEIKSLMGLVEDKDPVAVAWRSYLILSALEDENNAGK